MNSKAYAPTRQRPGTAAYQRGQETAASILHQARDMAIRDGLAGLSMRGLAKALDMSPGNLSYYYASRTDLIGDLVTFVITPYLQEFERLRSTGADDPETQLRDVLGFVYDDLSSRETTLFFPDLWALSLRDKTIEAQMEGMYSTYRSVLADIIVEMRPELDATTIADLALILSATLEGFTVFTGYERPHSHRAGFTKTLVIEQLVNTVRAAAPPN